MFRKGGQVMEGVMSLASGGRAKYQDAGRVTMQDLIKDDPFLKEVYQTAQAGYGRDIQQERSDVLANLLIRGGLGLVSGEGAGKGTLGAIATAFRGPTEQALAEMSKLKQDPAAMLTAKTAIEQKGAERLARIQNENKLLDAQKKAEIIVGPQKSGESTEDYAARVNAEAKKIIKESEYGVGERFKEGIKQDDIEIIQKQYLLEKPEAEKYYNFQKKKEAIEDKTGKPVQGYIDGTRTKGGKIDYSRKAKNKPDGIYYDPKYDVYLQIENGQATQIQDPLSAASIEGQQSTVPKVSTDKVVTKEPGTQFLEQKGNNPFLNIG
jgi:hypothetical protein